ncbi:MAG TPA: NAD+ synthase [Desulfocapsa sulfexigens]|nr:NAD+ synthase [Desulfocapsa sulfexigens]
MKIALVQINPVIGDFDYNCRKILDACDDAVQNGCSLIIFPELAVSGYPPHDLLERPAFLGEHNQALDTLCGKFPEIDVLVGCIEQRQKTDRGKKLYNSAFFIRKGHIIHRIQKQLLPTYDVFDEKRWFEPGMAPEIIECQGLRLGITICEDIWHSEIGEYDLDPVEALFADNQQIDCLINISASPFQRDKESVRHRLFRNICTRHQVPLLYVNQVGGQDSLLFDGRSLLMDAHGTIRAKSLGFTEDTLIVESDDWSGNLHEPAEETGLSAVCDALVMGIRDYVGKCGFKTVVLGLSGGIDSALTAALAVKALGPGNVFGVALPSPYSSDDSMEDAEALVKNLGCNFEIIPISNLFASFKESLQPLFGDSPSNPSDLTEQNLQARIRGNLLMALSNKFGHLLLSTGNKSEMAVGYCTLYGDMNGGLAVISDVPKQLVYGLSRFINREKEIIPLRTITKAPTAELKPDQCDQDDLPDYKILDQILEMHLEEHLGVKEIMNRGFSKELVTDVLRRVRINEYKRKQAPMGLKVTSKAFGYGRRYPNVQNFKG